MVAPGSLLQDRFRVLDALGRGGFGEVFEVEDLEEQGIPKVLKVLDLSTFSPSSHPKIIQLFQREVEILSQICHPGIPQLDSDGYFVLSQSQQLPLHCLVMEKIPGVNLKQWLQTGGVLKQTQAIDWLKQLLSILIHLHQQQFFHRDIKPANIMLRPEGRLVLIDFGAVREITLTYLAKQQQQATGTAVISAGYTPPEQVEGQAVAQSDFFALGRTFVYLLTGEDPINLPKDPQTGQLVWSNRIREGTELSPLFVELIDQLMAPFPGQRPQSGDAVVQMIQKLERHLLEGSIAPIAVVQKDLRDVPNTSSFYGRIEELSTLKRWILGNSEQETISQCRLITVLGMGGIGKTSLVAKLIEQIQDQFEFVIWRSLLNAPPLTEILADWIKFLSGQQESQLPEDLNHCLSRLRYYLQTHRCLLILDNVESILQAGIHAGSYIPGYECYGYLFDQIGTAEHQSSLFLTSREKPKEIALLEGDLPEVQSFALKGLSRTEGQEFFKAKGCYSAHDEDLEEISEHYDGNPLALKIVASAVQELTEGDVTEVLPQLRQGRFQFDDIDDILKRQWQRLARTEQTVMYWLAINREPVSLTELQSDVVSEAVSRQLLAAVQSLSRRSLIERSNKNWTLQPVVMEYVTCNLITKVSEEITAQQYSMLSEYALSKAQSKDYVRQAQAQFIIQPVVNQLSVNSAGTKRIEWCLKELLAKLRKETARQVGYTPGNIFNLLRYLNINLEGYDFSHLPVWQASLQGAVLHNVNFTNAEFSKCIFTQTFGNVLSGTFSPDGKVIATGNADGNIYLWSVEDGQHLLTLEGHSNWVRRVAFSLDGRLLVSGSEDQTMRIWNLQDGSCIQIIRGHALNLRSVAISPRGDMIASTSDDQTIRLWDFRASQCIRVLEGHQHWVLSASFSPDGSRVVSSSCDQTLRIWDVQTGQCLQVIEGHTSWVVPVNFSPCGRKIVSAGFDQTVRIWDAETGVCLNILQKHTGWVWSAAFSPDGKYIASAGVDQTIRIWDAETGHCLRVLKEHTKQVWAVMFHPDGQRLASCGEDQTVRFWSVETGRCLRVIKGYANWIRSVTFSHDGQAIFSAHHDHIVRIWDAHNYHWLNLLEGHTDSVMAVACSPDGRYLASAGEDRSVRLWQVSERRCLSVLTGHAGGVWAVTFSLDSRRIISAGCDNTVRVWDIPSATCLHVMQGHNDRILSLASSPTDQWVASASEDQTIRIWDIQTGKCIHTIQESARVMSVVFSPNGQVLASSSLDCTIKLWDMKNGRSLQTLTGHTGWVMTLAFSPDGKTLVSGSCDKTIKFWRISSGECLNTLEQHQNWIWSIAFSRDGCKLISASEDETIKVWQVETGECLATLQAWGPYKGMRITGVSGLTSAQKATLIALGAVESTHSELDWLDDQMKDRNSQLIKLTDLN
ncbi:protein kinase [Leptolyngbya sp. GB1-A1]|uniref:WD40 domain-containing protein n=1 Tax=Leptolyngbya sp. GB1-A1 TaxID=2933908 RepID=UPI0032997C5F